MAGYEYKVIPAPSKGVKAPGVKGAEARFAHGLEVAMNALAADGWEYLRADILPSEERQGLTSTHTVYRSVLVFRRAVPGEETVAAAPTAAETDMMPAEPEPAEDQPQDLHDQETHSETELYESPNPTPAEADDSHSWPEDPGTERR